MNGAAESQFSVNKKRTTTNRKVKDPRVEACPELCMFKNDNNSWCFFSNTPMLRAGWEVNQVFGTVLDPSNNNAEVKYLNIEIAPYIEGEIYIESLFNIERLYENEFIIDLAQF